MAKKSKKVLIQDGVPSPAGSKKEVLRLRSVNNMVIAPASTGRDKRRRTAVIKTAHTKSGVRCMYIPVARML